MTIPTHFLISWHLARHISPDLKTRRWICAAGVIPDLDGLGLFADIWTGQTTYYFDWHHRLGHNFLVGLLFAVLAASVCRSPKVGFWAWVCFHLHMIADLISGKGPEGSPWPLYYLWPLSDREWFWDGQWKLHAWPNTVVFAALLAWAVAATRQHHRSPFEMFSTRMDARAREAFSSVWSGLRSKR